MTETATEDREYTCGVCNKEFTGEESNSSLWNYSHHLFAEHQEDLGVDFEIFKRTAQEVLVYRDNLLDKEFDKISDFLSDGARALILPRMENDDLRDNENILTSPVFLLSEMCRNQGISIVHMDREKDFDVILSRFSGNDIEEEPRVSLIETGKPYFEFGFGGLAGRWFIERFGINEEWDDVHREEDDVIQPKDEVLGFEVDKLKYE